ncbi:DUF1707 and FHA domain-containing protein [Streptomyces misionensis]|uniref:DUF1707 and FHA domain-containing protein n=1 Tax=Streptomyces misionensis TaxID=67331 RepID=UPI0033B85356
MTSSFEFSTSSAPVPASARLSDAERERALEVLRDGVAKGRLSHDTFVRRMELVLGARHADEIAVLVADLPRENRFSRALFGSIEAVSGFTVRLRRAWQAERLPKLLLPGPEHLRPLRIGRDPGNGLRLTHETVSRVHAELSHQGGLWILRDLGSTNGTTVNGRRVIGAVAVREGDQVAFGRVAYRLAVS